VVPQPEVLDAVLRRLHAESSPTRGEALHRKIAAKESITVDYLVQQLFTYLDQFVQTRRTISSPAASAGRSPSSFAARAHPHLVNRVVLLCPSGMGDKEQLPIMNGSAPGTRGRW